MTLKEKAKKLVLDYDYFKSEKEYLTNFEFEIIDFAQYLNEYNLILQGQNDKVFTEKHNLLQKIEKLQQESRNKQNTIEQLKKNNIKQKESEVFIMNKQNFDKTKLNNEHDVMKKLNDLLNENEVLKTKLTFAKEQNISFQNYAEVSNERRNQLYFENQLLKKLLDGYKMQIEELNKKINQEEDKTITYGCSSNGSRMYN